MSNKSGKLFNRLIDVKQKQFTGKLDVQSYNNRQWKLYLCLGRLVWTDGGIHPHRSWKRLLNKYCPQIKYENIRPNRYTEKEYSRYITLTKLLENNLVKREQVINLVKAKIAGDLFDLFQEEHQNPLDLFSKKSSASSFLTSGLKSIALVNLEEAVVEARETWLIWVHKELTFWSPNLAPIMKKQDELKEEVSGIVYQNFIQLLDGQKTLRDLAYRMNKDVCKLTASIVPYIKLGLLDLIEIDDLKAIETSRGLSLKTAASDRGVILCIDDSPQIGRIMEQIITKSGYHYLGVRDALQAVPSVISANPKLIFLDIAMPIANGYEVCSQIRRIAKFKETPIVMVTGNDGIIDRVRAKLVGATDFIAKPIEIDKIVRIIHKFMVMDAQK